MTTPLHDFCSSPVLQDMRKRWIERFDEIKRPDLNSNRSPQTLYINAHQCSNALHKPISASYQKLVIMRRFCIWGATDLFLISIQHSVVHCEIELIELFLVTFQIVLLTGMLFHNIEKFYLSHLQHWPFNKLFCFIDDDVSSCIINKATCWATFCCQVPQRIDIALIRT